MGSLTVAIGVDKRKARIAMKVLIQIKQQAITNQFTDMWTFTI
jgi:hypothetical protein